MTCLWRMNIVMLPVVPDVRSHIPLVTPVLIPGVHNSNRIGLTHGPRIKSGDDKLARRCRPVRLVTA